MFKSVFRYSNSLCLLIKARPEPDFKYFSRLKAVYLFEQAKYEISLTGTRSFVALTCPLLCLFSLALKLFVQPI